MFRAQQPSYCIVSQCRPYHFYLVLYIVLASYGDDMHNRVIMLFLTYWYDIFSFTITKYLLSYLIVLVVLRIYSIMDSSLTASAAQQDLPPLYPQQLRNLNASWCQSCKVSMQPEHFRKCTCSPLTWCFLSWTCCILSMTKRTNDDSDSAAEQINS